MFHRRFPAAAASVLLLAAAGLASAQTDGGPAASQPDAPTSAPAPDPMEEVGMLLAQSRWADAADAARAVVQATPERPEAWALLGYALHADGRLDEALPAHLMAAEFEATAAIGRYNVACVYSVKGKTDKALAWLRKAREAGFDNFGAFKNDPDLNNIRGDERFAALVKPHPLMRSPEGPSVIRRNPHVGAGPQERLLFLLGGWRLTGEGGRELGDAQVESRTHGVLVEHRHIRYDGEPARETTIWWYEPATEAWRMVAVRGDGAVTRAPGVFRDLAWTFQGRRTNPDGVIDDVRTVIRPLRRGGVRRSDERTDDGGATWVVERDMHYTVPPPKTDENGG